MSWASRSRSLRGEIIESVSLPTIAEYATVGHLLVKLEPAVISIPQFKKSYITCSPRTIARHWKARRIGELPNPIALVIYFTGLRFVAPPLVGLEFRWDDVLPARVAKAQFFENPIPLLVPRRRQARSAPRAKTNDRG